MTTSESIKAVERLRKAVLSAASLLQEVPEGELPDAETIDFLESDLLNAERALEEIQDCMPPEGE